MTVAAILRKDGTWSLTGLTADTKPDGVPTGSHFFETDTGLSFYWNGAAWSAAGITADEQDALVGTYGHPDAANPYVTATDPVYGGIASTVAHDTHFSAVTVSTESATFVDALAGSSVQAPSDGDYLAIFSGECTGSNSNNQLEVAVGKNSTVAALADTGRLIDTTAANDIKTFHSSTVLTALTTLDTIHGIFRRSDGSGSSSLFRRRLLLLKVS